MGEQRENQKINFSKMLFSELGENCEYPEEAGYKNGLSKYGACMEMASHTCKVLINNFPWKKASVKKIETPMDDREDISVIKLVTIRLEDGYAVKNPELSRVLKYMVSMLSYENSKEFSPMLHQLYTDAMAAHKFAIDRYGYTKSGEIVSITFRFALTKWDGKWGKRKEEISEAIVDGSSDIISEVEESAEPIEAEPKPAVEEKKKKTSNKKKDEKLQKHIDDEYSEPIGNIIKNKN